MKKSYNSVRWVGTDEKPSFNWKKREETLCDLIEALSENLKIALLIPEILENPQTICQCLKNSKYEQAIEIINDFLRDKGEGPQEEIPTYPDRATNSLIDYFINNSGILRYIPKVVKYLNQNQLKLLSYLEIIKNIAGGNLSKTSLAAMEMKSNINQTQHNNEDLKNYIEKTRREIEEMKSKQNVVQPPEPRYVKMPPYDDIEKAEIDTDEEIFKVRQYHAITEKDLVEKLKAERSLYEGNVKKNVGLEKSARAQFNKQMFEMQALFKEYDQMLLRKMQEEIVLNNRCEKLQKDVDEFQIEFNRAEEIYNELMSRDKRWSRFRIVTGAVKILTYWYKHLLKRRKKAALKDVRPQGKNTKTADVGIKRKKVKRK